MRPKAVKVRASASASIVRLGTNGKIFLNYVNVRAGGSGAAPVVGKHDSIGDVTEAVNLLLPEFIVLEGGEKISFGEGEWRDVHAWAGEMGGECETRRACALERKLLAVGQVRSWKSVATTFQYSYLKL